LRDDSRRVQTRTRNATSDAVCVQTNTAPNEVIAFRRADDGSLERIGSVATGGDGSPHLQSQGSVALTGNGRYLLVTNAASDDLSVFAVAADGLLRLRDRVHTGTAPGSVAERDGLYSPLIRRERFRCRGGVPKGQERSSEYSGEEWAAGNEEELCGYGRPAANPISAAPKADAVTLRPAPMVKT
jgi:6-phosphogluconolactonase